MKGNVYSVELGKDSSAYGTILTTTNVDQAWAVYHKYKVAHGEKKRLRRTGPSGRVKVLARLITHPRYPGEHA